VDALGVDTSVNLDDAAGNLDAVPDTLDATTTGTLAVQGTAPPLPTTYGLSLVTTVVIVAAGPDAVVARRIFGAAAGQGTSDATAVLAAALTGPSSILATTGSPDTTVSGATAPTSAVVPQAAMLVQ
jgi:hypothetical protein